MKADHLHKSNSLALHKFGKYKKSNKTILNCFPFTVDLWMYGAQLAWQKQGNLEYKPHFEALPEHCGLVSTNVESWITNTLCVGATGRYKRPQNTKISAFQLTLQQHI
jgi:hypothetical protein